MNHAYIGLIDKYAQAFLNVFQFSLTSENIEMAVKAADFFKQHCNFLFLLQTTKKDGSQEIQTIIERYHLPHSFYTLALIIIKAKRALLLSDVLYRIVYYYNKRNGRVSFKVKSAIALDRDHKQEIIDYLEKKTGNRVLATFMVDESLIAGIVLQSDEYKWDYSIKSRLNAIQNLLKR